MRRVGSLVTLGASSHQPDVFGVEQKAAPAVFSEQLTVAAMHDPPAVFIHEGSPGNLTYSGYLVDLWTIIAEQLNVTYRMLPPTRDGYGALLDNGTWTGLVGEVARKRADIILSKLVYRVERGQILDYVDRVPIWISRYDFYVRAGGRSSPEIDSGMFESLLRPLNHNAWIVMLLCLLVLAVVLTVTVRLNRSRGETDLTCREFTLGSSCLSVFMTVTGQGWALTPDSASARIITISSWMLGILITMGYTANLISYLTLSQPEAPIASLAAFDNRPDWTVAMEHGVAHLGDWLRGSDPIKHRIRTRVVTADRFLPLDGSVQALRRAVQPKTLLFYDISLAFIALKEEACALLPLPLPDPDGRSERHYITMKKGLEPLHDAINNALHRMRQTGTVDRLQRKWFSDSRHLCSDGAVFRPLALADLLAVLVIVPLAVLSSGLLLAAELLGHRLRSGSRA